MTDEEKRQRAIHLCHDEFIAAKGISSWFYLSYADENGFRGGLYLKAFGPASAAIAANLQKLSPGGEVRIFPIPDDESYQIPEGAKYHLLSLEDLEKLHPMKSMKDLEEEDDN
jgi:hypothetical protein